MTMELLSVVSLAALVLLNLLGLIGLALWRKIRRESWAEFRKRQDEIVKERWGK